MPSSNTLPVTGIRLIDRQHEHYLEITERILGAFDWSDVTPRMVEAEMEELATFTIEHFDAEEHIMRATDYPAYDEHVRKHDLFRQWVDRLLDKFQTGTAGPDDMESVPKWLLVWFTNQVQTDDMRLAEYLRESGEAARY